MSLTRAFFRFPYVYIVINAMQNAKNRQVYLFQGNFLLIMPVLCD